MAEEEKEHLSEIKKIRLRNIAERKKKFKDLNLDSLKKQARADIEYRKAQIAAKRLQCKECGKKFATESLKRQHITSVHIEPRSTYPRDARVKKKKKPRGAPKKKPPATITFTYFFSQDPDGSQKTYCTVCGSYVRPFPANIRMHLDSPKHKKHVRVQPQRLCVQVPKKSQKIMNTRQTLDSHKDNKKDKNCEICKIASKDLTGHLMTHMKPCSVLILKVDMNKKV